MNKYIIYIYISFVAILLVSCKKVIDKNIRPSNDRSDVELLTTLDGLVTATNGNYALLVTQSAGDAQYSLSWYNMSELKGNTLLSITRAYPQTRNDAYIFENSPSQGLTSSFWRLSYRIVFGANKIIDAIPEGKGAAYDQLKGENYFLRALSYFNMVRVYGKPYYQDSAEGLAVPLSLSSMVDKGYMPKRNTVKEVYAQIILDLEKAETLMTQSRPNNYATKEAAQALLSRVYLYMGGTESAPQNEFNSKASEYADKVITSNKFTLLQGTAYTSSFAIDGKTNKEYVFAFRHDDANGNKINEFLTPRDVYGNPYQGEYAASPVYLALLKEEDLRRNFIKDEFDKRITDTENPDKMRKTITKFNFQQISPPGGFDFSTASRSSTPYLRLAEMYLNKAEALAKSGNVDDALKALNVVRTRAGVSEWTSSMLSTEGKTLMQAILEERKLELAWEGHASFDDFRNGLPMIRDFGDYNAPSVRIEATDIRVVYPLPEKEIELNPNLKQNPL